MTVSGNASVTKTICWSVGLYIAACFCPALIFHVREHLGAGGSVWNGYRNENGFSLLVTGLLWRWIRMNFTALANIFLWLSWIALGRSAFRMARGLSVVALLVSVETLQLYFQPFLWDEGGTNQGYLAAPHIGFFLWIASIVVVYWASRHANSIDSTANLLEAEK